MIKQAYKEYLCLLPAKFKLTLTVDYTNWSCNSMIQQGSLKNVLFKIKLKYPFVVEFWNFNSLKNEICSEFETKILSFQNRWF